MTWPIIIALVVVGLAVVAILGRRPPARPRCPINGGEFLLLEQVVCSNGRTMRLLWCPNCPYGCGMWENENREAFSFRWNPQDQSWQFDPSRSDGVEGIDFIQLNQRLSELIQSGQRC